MKLKESRRSYSMGFFDKLKQGLFKTKDALVHKVDELFKSLKNKVPNESLLALAFNLSI